MARNIIRAILAAFVALALGQGTALSATVNMSDLEGEITLNTLNTDAFFSASHALSEPAIDDQFLVNFNVGDTAVSTILFTTPGTSNPTGLDLELYLVDSIISPVIEYTTLVANGTGSLVAASLLASNKYLLRVFANLDGQDIRSYNGQITATPLPPALLIFGTGLFGLGLLSRHRRKRQGRLGLQT